MQTKWTEQLLSRWLVVYPKTPHDPGNLRLDSIAVPLATLEASFQILDKGFEWICHELSAVDVLDFDHPASNSETQSTFKRIPVFRLQLQMSGYAEYPETSQWPESCHRHRGILACQVHREWDIWNDNEWYDISMNDIMIWDKDIETVDMKGIERAKTSSQLDLSIQRGH